MPIYEFKKDTIVRLASTSFSANGVKERYDLQRLLKDNIEVIAADTLVISEEYSEWEDSKRSIDLLAVDHKANLVVIELKRTEDGGHMELQAIRYAAMVSTMTFELAVDAFSKYLKKTGKEDTARKTLLEFFGWDDANSGEFADRVRIILASADFSKEITSSAIWLNDNGLDVRCVRLVPYKYDDRILVDIQQIVPVPEAEDYQIRIREKNLSEKQAKTSNMDFTKFDVKFDGETQKAMWKRNAIYFLSSKLCEKGVKPEEITALFDWRPGRGWYVVEGQCDKASFIEKANERATNGGPAFDDRRWFCDDEELVHFEGRTYAFSSQWGGDNWHRAMNLLVKTYPQYKIEYTAT